MSDIFINIYSDSNGVSVSKSDESPWISVEDRLPECDPNDQIVHWCVVTHNTNINYQLCWCDENGDWHQSDGKPPHLKPTAYIPIPYYGEVRNG